MRIQRSFSTIYTFQDVIVRMIDSEYIILYGIILNEYHYIRISVLTCPSSPLAITKQPLQISLPFRVGPSVCPSPYACLSSSNMTVGSLSANRSEEHLFLKTL